MKGMAELGPSEYNVKWWKKSAGIKTFLPWGFAGIKFASNLEYQLEGEVEEGAPRSLASGNNYLELHWSKEESHLISISLTYVGYRTHPEFLSGV